MGTPALRLQLARLLSVAGHPALLMPLAVVGSGWVHGAPAAVLQAGAAASGAVAIGVGLYSLRKVRQGHWTHMDASVPQERGELHRFLVPLLLGAAALLAATGQPLVLATGLALGAAMVGAAHGLRRWLKVSLHTGFGVFAAALLWPSVAGVLALAALALGVAWSRLVLGRHAPAEVLVGGVLGLLGGAAFQVLAL